MRGNSGLPLACGTAAGWTMQHRVEEQDFCFVSVLVVRFGRGA